MILWDRNKNKITGTSSEDRRELAGQMCTKRFLKKVEKGNNLINIAVPAGIFALCGFDLVALAAGFIATDIILCFIDNEVFVKSPYRRLKRMSLEDVESNIEKLSLEKDSIYKTISKLRADYCDKCHSYSGSRYSCTDCSEMRGLHDDMSKIESFIEREEAYLRAEKGKIRDKEIENNNKKSDDYQNKLHYFNDVKDRLKYFIDKKDVEFLKPVHEAMEKLINVLEEKEIGFSLISTTFYIYLDELQGILDKFFSLNKSQRETYSDKVVKLSELIEDHISSVVNRIEKLEVEDLEIDIDVLMAELERKVEEDNV